MATQAAAPARRFGAGYQACMVAILSLNFGIVFFDRNALNFLMPFVQPDLHLSNTQVGLFQSALSLTWALAALGMGRLSDRTGRRKLLLVAATIAFSLCSFLSGIAATFGMLLATRLLMGVAEGGVMPISHAMIAAEVSPERRGLAQGIGQNFGSNLLGSFLAPVLLVSFALSFGWRQAFYLAGIPGLVSALLILLFVKEPATGAARVHDRAGYGPLQALKERNVLICVVMGVLLVAYLVICWSFMPLFLTQVRRVSPGAAGWLMGTLGISATIGSFAISGLSDRIGRRPVMIAIPFIATVLPLGALFWGGSLWGLAAIFFVGWSVNGIFPLFMATVPSESVAPAHAATVLGLCMGSSELLGGVFGPLAAGWAADGQGLGAPMWIMVGLTVAAGFLAFGLRETAPSQVGRARRDAADTLV